MLNIHSVKGPFGALFLCDYNPTSSNLILLIPPLAEEMNKSRHILRQQAEQFVAKGYRVIVPDLSGTGDSSGTLAETSPDQWHAELTWLIDQAKSQGATSLTLWAVRGGALFIPRLLVDSSLPIARVILWSPVLKGTQWVNQFIRLRTAAAMMAGKKESANDIKAQLNAGELLEIAGYQVSAASLLGLEALELSAEPLTNTSVLLVDVTAKGVASPVISKFCDALNSSELLVAEGDAYWGTQELACADAVIELTTQALPSVGLDSSEQPIWTEFDASTIKVNTGGVIPYRIPFQGQSLMGALNPVSGSPETAIIMVVGGPQYRIGSHQQFKQLADHFQRHGVMTLRFDYCGMGDTSGNLKGFEYVDGEIGAAVDSLFEAYPSLQRVMLWGLCDAASAILFYAHKDPRVSQVFMLNPWVRSEQGEAQAYLKHYYWSRLTSKAFWKKCFSGGLDLKASMGSLASTVKKVMQKSSSQTQTAVADPTRTGSLAERCSAGMTLFSGPITLVMSGQDLTAAEFRDQVLNQSKWSKSTKLNVLELPEADHTFSNQAMRLQVAQATLDALGCRP